MRARWSASGSKTPKPVRPESGRLMSTTCRSKARPTSKVPTRRPSASPPLTVASQLDAALQREGLLGKPLVEGLVKGQSGLGALRRVHVDVHEAGQAVAALPQLRQHAGLSVGPHELGLVRAGRRHDTKK